MDTARYVFGVLVVVCLPPGILWWFLVHPCVALWRSLGVRKTLVVMSVFQLVTLVGLFLVRDHLLLTDFGFRWPLLIAAAALVAGSVAIAAQRRKQLTTRTLVGVPEIESNGPGELLREGIYARTRNPRYIEVLGFTLAYALFSNHLGPYLVTAAALPVIHLVVLLEEQELGQRFGEEYRDYCQRVPRYLPRRARAVH